MFLFECFLAIVLSFVWAVFFIAHSLLVNQLHLPVVVTGFWTRIVGIALLFAAIVLNGNLGAFLRPGPLLRFALLIGAGAFCINLCGFYGVRYTSVSSGSVIYKTDILFTLLASRFLLRERMRPHDWAGTALMVAGTVALLWPKIVHMEPSLRGDLLFLLAAFLLTVNAFIIKTKLSAMSNDVTATYNSSVTMAGFTVLLLTTGHYSSCLQALASWQTIAVIVTAGISIAALFLLYYRALERLPFWLVRVLLLFTPVWAVVIECAFLHKTLLRNEIGGMVLILAGATLIVVFHDRRQRGTRPTEEKAEENAL